MTTKKKLIEFLERREYNKIKAEDIDFHEYLLVRG